MKNKYLSLTLIGLAIAFLAPPLKAEEKANPESAKSVFVCAVQGDTPTLFAYNPGQVNLTPIMTWHNEYLIPEQSGAKVCQETATKLQNSYQQQHAKYLKSETTDQINQVCLVNDKAQNCLAKGSETLFSVNPKYNATCVLENKTPIDCQVYKVRGVYSFDDEPYQAVWWPW